MILMGAVLLALAVPPAPQPIQITGRVVDWEKGERGKGAGVPGARVELFPANEGPIRGAPLASAHTDAEGFYEISAPESGCFRLVVRAEGSLVLEHPLAPLVEDRQLSPAGVVRFQPFEVRTVGAAGRPIQGAKVRILPRVPLARENPQGWSWIERQGVTNADGRVSLPILEGENPEVAAVAPGFLERRVTLTPASRVVRLSPNQEPRPNDGGKPAPPWRISGRVTHAVTGKPVAGALVWSGWPPVAPPVRTDGGGRFQYEVPSNSPFSDGAWLETAATGFLQAERRYVRPSKQGLAPAEVLVKLEPAAEISGQVIDEAGRPVAGALIQLNPPRDSDQALDLSGVPVRTDGRFRLTGLKPGSSYKLTARRQGHGRSRVTAHSAAAGQPPAPALRIVLGNGKTAFGRVVDAAGQPVVEVQITLIDPTAYGEPLEARTNAEGRFEIRHLDSGTYLLSAFHPSRAGLEMREIEIPATSPSVDLGDLTLPADGAIEGRVTDSKGRPVEGAEVALREAQDLSDGTLSLGGDNWGTALTLLEPRSGRTGPDGAFRVEGLKLGHLFDLRVKHPAYSETTLSGVGVPTKEPVRIEIKTGHRVSGRVVDAEGEPVAGASLAWNERGEGVEGLLGSRRPVGWSDSEGRFQVSGLPAGNLDLEVSAEGYQTRWMDGLRVPDEGDLEDVKVVLGQGSWLDVRVLGSAGEPVPGASLIAHPKDYLSQMNPRKLVRAFSQGTTDSQGRCRMSLPEPGSYTVQILGPAGQASVDVAVSFGGTAVEIPLSSSGAGSGWPSGAEVAEESEPKDPESEPSDLQLSGRVLVDGMPLGGADVVAGNKENKSSGRSGRTAYDGTFTLRDLPAGPLFLVVLGSPGITASRNLQRVENDEVVVEITTGSFRATVLAATGEPLEGAVATLEPWIEETPMPLAAVSARSGADGTLEVSRLAPGIYRLEVQKEGFELRQETVEIRPGGGTVLEVRLGAVGP